MSTTPNLDEDLELRLTSLLRKALQLEVPSARTDIIDTGILDSIAFVNLIVGIEEEFGFAVEVEEIELDDFRTIDSIVGYLARRRAAGAGNGAGGAAGP